jgi:hypothetical protein
MVKDDKFAIENSDYVMILLLISLPPPSLKIAFTILGLMVPA